MQDCRQLVINLTGELVTITGRREARLALSAARTMTWRDAFAQLGQTEHEWFGLLAVSEDGRLSGLGQVLLLHNGRMLSWPHDLTGRAEAGSLYIIPPIPGG